MFVVEAAKAVCTRPIWQGVSDRVPSVMLLPCGRGDSDGESQKLHPATMMLFDTLASILLWTYEQVLIPNTSITHL